MFYLPVHDEILAKASRISMLILDVDGVLSDGRIFITANAEEIKSFHTLDGHGIKLLQKAGIQTAIITGRDAPSVAFRAQQLGIHFYMAGISDKKTAFDQLLTKSALSAEQCAYMGDDLPDLPVMKRVQLSACPPQAHPIVLQKANYRTHAFAGMGAVREFCDLILYAQGHYQTIIQEYWS